MKQYHEGLLFLAGIIFVVGSIADGVILHKTPVLALIGFVVLSALTYLIVLAAAPKK